MPTQATLKNLRVDMVTTFRQRGRALIMADLLVKALAFVVVSPALAAAWRGYLAWTGRPVLTDAEIAEFLVHPWGWAALVFLGGAAAAVAAVGCSALIWIAAGRTGGGSVAAVTAVVASLRRAPALFGVSAMLIAVLLAVAAPFGVGVGVTYRVFLTEHDINYYLAARPPAFWWAAGVSGLLIAGMAAIWLGLLLRWALALPAIMLEGCSPRESLRRSATLTRGHRKGLLITVAIWGGLVWVFAACVTAAAMLVVRVLLGRVDDSLWHAALVAGAAVLLWSMGQLLVAVAASTSFAIGLVRVYAGVGGGGVVEAPPIEPEIEGPTYLRPRWVGLGLSAAVVVAGIVGAWSIQDVELEDDVLITAHRGASATAPENTMAAFALAIEQGADFIELDVQETRDGRVAVVHDQDLLRSGGPATKVWDATLAELQTTDLSIGFDARYAGQTVPPLSEVFELAQGRISVNVELKYYGHDDRLEARVIDLIEKHDMQDHVVVMSLHAAGIAKVRKQRPDWTVGLLAAKTLGDLSRADVDFLAVHHALATPGFIRAAHRRGQQVHVWTVNDPTLMSSLISRGVDVLITDDPGLARRVLAERAELSLVERSLLDLTVRLGLNPSTDNTTQDRP